MKEWVMVASRAEAKIFKRDAKSLPLKWQRTLVNKKGRRREHDFKTDKFGQSYAKWAGSKTPHRLAPHNSHTEVVADHFAHTLAKLLRTAKHGKLYQHVTVFANPHLLGKIKKQVSAVAAKNMTFIAKDLEKADIPHILKHLDAN
ncbi:MAG: host attachment protein [Bdellovibrionales bacterium]